MSTILLLLIPVVIVNGLPQQIIVGASLGDNYCMHPCPRSCSPQCLPNCCSGSSSSPSPAGILLPSASANLCVNPCPRSCSPQCSPSCCAGPRPDFVIGSVEEGETEECGEKGFGSPTDNSLDPPGTITIPLPSTVYTPPKPGEAPKELPLPNFQLPASILNGNSPSKSMTLSPDGALTPPGCPQTSLVTAKPQPVIPALSKPVLTSLPSPPPPPPVPPPPAPPAIQHVSGGSLPYPKLPPVTISEIPNRVNRLPPLLYPKLGKPVMGQAPAGPLLSLPKPPPIHVTVGGAGNVGITGAAVSTAAAAPPPAPVAVSATPCEVPCTSPNEHIAHNMEQELDSRYGVSYGNT